MLEPSRKELETENTHLRAALSHAGVNAERALAETAAARKETRQARDDMAGIAADHARDAKAGRADLADAAALNAALRRANAALAESEDHLRAVLASAIDYAMVATNLDGRVTGWNEGARRVLGWTESEMLWRDVRAIWTPEDCAAGLPEAEMRAALAEGTAVDERWHMRHDGTRFWAQGQTMPLRGGGDGAPRGFLKILRDRTERMRAEEARRVDAEFLRSVLAASADCIKVLDLEGRLVFISEGGQRAMEVSDLNAIQGCPWPDFWPYEEAEARAAVDAAKAGGIGRFRGFAPTMAGTPKSWDVQVTPMLGADGRPERLLSISRDITEQRAAEQALRELNETLEARVTERTAELMHAEEALRQAQKMEAVGQLTGGLAHDFNNLLTGITGSLELLQTRVGQGRINDLDRYVVAAQGAAKRAAALTHRLLAFSRRQTLDPKPVNASRLVSGMEELVQRTVGPAVTVEVVAAGGLWTTLCDPHQLENALLNLCINARDAMPDGGRLTVESGNKWLDARAAREHDLPPGQYVTVCVSDTGAGMAPDVAARAFDPFFTTKPIGQGTGLGLSMVYGFARQSGGQARIYSEPGQGTAVCLYLPRHHAGEAGEADTLAEPAEPPQAAEQGRTVLVVDDEPTVRMLAAEVLGELGCTAIEAADGAAGLRVLQSDARIDLLITDVGLPGGMNGRQMADAGRTARPGLKVLFITGYAENAVLSHGHLKPGMQVLTKPFALDALAARIRTLVAEG